MRSKRSQRSCTALQVCPSKVVLCLEQLLFQGFRGCMRKGLEKDRSPLSKCLPGALGLWRAQGVSSGVWDFVLCAFAVPSGAGSPEPWIWMSSGDRRRQSRPAPCLFVGAALCCCFSSLMRAEHTIKFYWVFMLTKLTNSWCFKNAAGALSAITGICNGFLTGVGQSKCVSANVI